MESAMIRFIDKVYKILPKEHVLCNEPLKKYTSFRIGGPADYLVFPDSNEQVSQLIHLCHTEDIPVFILGNGSNILVTDKGIRGMVIQLGERFSRITTQETCIQVQTGAKLSQIARVAAQASLTGMEFASGIPGTVGGAVFMNAGAYGGEMEQIVTQVIAVNREGELVTLSHDMLKFGYRQSALQTDELTALEVELTLKEGNQKEINAYMCDLNQRRREKQPLEYPSAGSTFKRPTGFFAGKLIMDAQLAGARIGDAMVSEKHCGFIINVGNATCADVLELIKYVQHVVYTTFQVQLEREVKIIGER